MLALGYARLSRDDPHSVSIEFQTNEITKLAKEQGYKLLNIEIDNGISGKSIKARPAVQRVLNAVSARSVDAVIVFRSDRMSRDGLQGLGIEKLFNDNGVRYVSCTEGILSAGSVDDIFMGFIRNGLNQRERQLISLRVKTALALKKSKGERLGCQLPYGWRVSSGNVIKVDHEQALVDRVRKLRKKGLSTYKIADKINSEGFRTRKSTPFSRTQICRMLEG